MQINTTELKDHKVPKQDTVGVWPAYALGWGSNAGENQALRKWLKRPGAPFGGLGFLDPKKAREEPDAAAKLPADLTADEVRDIKLEQFRKCVKGEDSMYYWALHPIYNTSDIVVAAEILVRARNGTDSAPFEDVNAIMDPNAAAEVKEVYITWKATEAVDWTLKALNDFPVLRTLDHITTNARPLDLPTTGPFYKEVSKRIKALSEKDRKLLLEKVVIEVTEDQELPENVEEALEAWKALGFQLAYDDTIGEKSCEMIAKKGINFHTPAALEPILKHFMLLKVDIDWAGYAVFLSHPSYSSRAPLKAEVLLHAREEDLVYITQGPGLKNTTYKHSVMLQEFANWAKDMITRKMPICIELSVSQTDENNALALNKLKEMGLDIFGEDQKWFSFQGGLTGAKAFQPDVLAMDAKIFEPATGAKLTDEKPNFLTRYFFPVAAALAVIAVAICALVSK